MNRRSSSWREPEWRLAPVISVVTAFIACGGETLPPDTGGGGQLIDACTEAAGLETALVADFEALPVVNWFASNDMTPGGVVEPAILGGSPLEAPKCATDAAAGSAFHVRAIGFTAYGYSFGFNGLNAIPGAGAATYFDTAEWTGLSMWVRKGSSDSNSSIFASVSDRFTDPSGDFLGLFSEAESAQLLAPAQCPTDQAMGAGCYCNFNAVDVDNNGTPDPLLSQCDRFGAGIGIATEWRFFKVPFSRMRQRAYGRPSALSQPDRAILGIDIGLDGENWDFWIDDIAFYRDPVATPQ